MKMCGWEKATFGEPVWRTKVRFKKKKSSGKNDGFDTDYLQQKHIMVVKLCLNKDFRFK